MKYKQNIVVVDYNVGNTFSVANSIQYLGYKVRVSSSEVEINKADFIVLPGVGAFKIAINNLKALHLDTILHNMVFSQNKPLLGICVGMQILADSSEEDGIHQGLGWISGKVQKIIPTNDDKVPHVGWNEVNQVQNSKVYSKVINNSCFYFDHSYQFNCEQETKTSIVEYAGQQITASVEKGNIYGVQYHPEKSQIAGLKLFRGFFESN